MPVRFLCPACHQLLSIGTRKIGAEVECPKCRSTIVVPNPQQPDPATAAPPTEPPSLFEQAGLEQALSAISARESLATHSETAPAYNSPPADALFPVRPAETAKPAQDDSLVEISRRVLYLQAALLALVAVVAFVCGYVIGGAAK
jgi:hypothetical protein